ncbi:nuclear transport factor 2 family protein [candidate division KSB1 bacterium]|nr:nuclear transport factor 2 family protein [candidate division KSB1 bacterium]
MSKLQLLLVFTVLFAINCTRQTGDITAEENAIKALVLKETTAWVNRDYDSFISAWAHKPYAVSRYATESRYYEIFGWDEIAKSIKRQFETNPDTLAVEFSSEEFKIYIENSTALITYIDHFVWDLPGRKVKNKIQESRCLMKENGQWKIVTLTCNYLSTEDSVCKYMQEALNNVGNKFIKLKKTKEAIEVFKLNNMLFPEISATYEAVAWGYTNDGNDAQAVIWAKKALEMIPMDKYSPEWEKKRTERLSKEKLEKTQAKE